jgi:hypothetical protein
MFGPQRIAGIVIAGVIIGGGGVGLAAPAFAAPCDSMQLSMSPHVGTTCQDPALVEPPAGLPSAPGLLDGQEGAQPAELAPPQAVAADGALGADPALQPAAGDFDLPPTG